mgnify:CR=1 FL=1
MRIVFVWCLSLIAVQGFAYTAKFTCDWKDPVVVEHAAIAKKVLALDTGRPGAKTAGVPPALARPSAPPPAPEVRREPIAKLPSEKEMWSLGDAGHIVTATRDKYSLNGLWAFEPCGAAAAFDAAPPVASMDYYFKVPGEWPSCKNGRTDGMAIYDKSGADVAGAAVKAIDSAWYARRVKVPESWRGRDVVVGFQWIPTVALVYVDGKKSGEVFFPGGEVPLGKIAPGEHEIAFFTTAKLVEKMVTAFDAPDAARTFTKKRASHAGVNGDVYLAVEPEGVKIDNVQARPSVRNGRIDFRELVKDLAAVFKTRIELRQIGVRDETKILGGVGICGRPLCCHSYLSEFIPVSIKMAKEQNLSLNPTKISGVCGRLMCCLNNEEETYEELNRKLPNVGDYVTTDDGLRGEVHSVNVLRQLVKVLIETDDEKELKEYQADQLKFKKKHKNKKESASNAELAELKELENLERKEKSEKLSGLDNN